MLTEIQKNLFFLTLIVLSLTFQFRIFLFWVHPSSSSNFKLVCSKLVCQHPFFHTHSYTRDESKSLPQSAQSSHSQCYTATLPSLHQWGGWHFLLARWVPPTNIQPESGTHFITVMLQSMNKQNVCKCYAGKQGAGVEYTHVFSNVHGREQSHHVVHVNT